MSEQHVSGLSFAGLEVSDLERSKAFYEDILGFSSVPAGRDDAVIMKSAEGLGSFALKAPAGGPDAAPKSGEAVALWFRCDDVDALAQRASEAGARVALPPQEGPFGRMTVVIEPDGHALTFHNA